MLFTLGSRTPGTADVVDLLLGCHRRVVEHLALGRRLAAAPRTTAPESVRSAASRIARYFGLAFPLHRADEEEDLFPLLIGRSDALDVAIGELTRDHDTHQADVADIVEVCTQIERDPAMLPAHAARLGDAVRRLEDELVAHLNLEERTVFPAIALLTAHERAALLERMRARRAAPAS